MDTHVVFDCQRVLPNRFALTLAAASRIRALARGAEPRLDAVDRSVGDLALHEIAAGVFTRDELAPFLPGADERQLLPPPDPASKLRDGGVGGAAAPASRSRKTVH
ncbi:DNA-directed RNA polymerase subunit omega [Ochrobactrum sp. 695/2009]|uniref:DNA-directed RNA polymerase subunit omega n=1 Tax=Brucella intermedia TaxID=94625 RepID=A0A7V6P972_9HYPH|nr:DNA-directed RNA polymerase subunit omega [Brucella intermedia]PJR92523.1 DNA-directed RNA polymerase subunit omega [Ochrobactrum sp. 721/2009]PJT13625.1 DNA-directed RNA polymerase subunit omega [Ochrobactrum sp. 720/2009]PJT18290.1 DNA-directed RNA polymerase subunit omega [Ochrobactrum sp. 715/2009]PJT28458.1 DNA-directed RNA polymerase subunit omega [Ochrobactrum sp. 695/2009]PJT31813.1 DNA-directed RNA polymerase subunit omega [Ochrobactrum sp. 689/2009]